MMAWQKPTSDQFLVKRNSVLDSDIWTESLFWQKCADTSTEVCRYSDTIITDIVRITGFLGVRIAVQPDIPTCQNNDILLSELRYTLVGISVRRNYGTQCSSQLHVGINFSSFPHTFHIGKDIKTTRYKSFSKYCKHFKQTSMLGTARMLPTDEKHDGLLHKLTKNKHVEVKRCRLFKKELLKGFRSRSWM